MSDQESKGIGPVNDETHTIIRELATLALKAALSSIPMASFVFDVSEKAFNFANAKQQRLLLEKIINDIDSINMQNKKAYQDIFNFFITKINEPVPDEYIESIKNVCLNFLENGYPENDIITSCIKSITPLELFVLKCYVEYWSENENAEPLAGGAKYKYNGIESGHRLASYLKEKIGIDFQYIYSTILTLRQKSILYPGIDGGVYDLAEDYADPVQVTALGCNVWRIMRFDPKP